MNKIAKKMPVPSIAQLREVSTRANRRFYEAFLGGEINLDNTLPAWVLPKLVSDERFGIAKEFLSSIDDGNAEKKGKALEWALIILDREARGISKREWVLLNKKPTDETSRKLDGIDVQREALIKLQKSLLERLDALSTCGTYKIKIPWIQAETDRLWGD